MHTYKRTSSPRSPTNTGELYTPAHEENVRFIHDSKSFLLRMLVCIVLKLLLYFSVPVNKHYCLFFFNNEISSNRLRPVGRFAV